MNDFSFWNTWVKPYKNLLFMLLALLAGSILYFIAVMWLGSELVIDWQNRASLEELQLPLLQKEYGLLNLNLEANSFVVRQTFWGSELKINYWPAHLLLVMLALGLSVALAVVSSLRRFWYISGMGLFCVIIVSLRLEQIQLFGRIDKTADIIVFLLFLPLSYYFQAIKSDIQLLVRMGAFLVLFGLMAGLMYFFSGVEVPFLYVANYGLPAFIVLSFLFILLVAPEIIAGILYLVTASNNEHSQNSLMHFLLASCVYLGNLLLYYLQIRGVLDLGIYLISPFWILLLSILVGFWTLRSRSEHFVGVITYEPSGALLYLALAIVCLGTMGYVFATANDPLVETFEDAILYTHLGLGFMFLLYILVNFFGLLKENKRVYRVLYKPHIMPLFSARLVGVIAIFGLYSLHGMFAVFQPMGGYYNGIGDLYLADGNYFLAEQYYKLGSQHKYANHRSNYALASLAMRVNRPVQAMLFLKEGIERQPTPYAYANLANLYFDNNLYFDGLFILREGIDLFPQEGRLYNNLGVQFGRTNVVDSALYYLRVAANDDQLQSAAEANEVALLARKRLSLESLDFNYPEGDLFYQTNLLALMNQNPALAQLPEQVNPVVLQELGGVETAWLLNYALLKEEPDSLLPRQLQQLIDSTSITYYEEPATLALGVFYYQQQNHFAAFGSLRELSSRSAFNRAKYFKLLGAWALEQEAPAMAARYFGQATEFDDAEAALLQAMALTEAGEPLQAGEVLLNVPDSLLNERLQNSKNELLMFLGMQDFSDFPGNQSEAAYHALRLQWGKLGMEEREALLEQILDLNWKGKALSWLASRDLRYGSLQQAEEYLQRLHQISSDQLEEPLKQRRAHLSAQLSIFKGEAAESSEASLQYPGTLGRLMEEARAAISSGDTLQAIRNYQQVMAASPFVEEGYLLATPLLNAAGNENLAYDFLLKALHFNPYSVVLKEQYILQSLRLSLDQYADDELESLREIAGKERFNRFMEQVEQIRQENANLGGGW